MADDKTTAAASPAATAQNEQRTATIRYIDRPEIDEVFADSVTGLLYDGQTLRMEFAVTRSTRSSRIRRSAAAAIRRAASRCRPRRRSISSTACSRSRPR